MEDRAPILIVEDDLDAQQLLGELLERRGHNVVTRSNGTEALAYLRHGPRPRLILLDLHMPIMDGYELRDRIASCEELSRIPIVVMTDCSSVDRAALGEMPMLMKPLKVNQLFALLDDAPST